MRLLIIGILLLFSTLVSGQTPEKLFYNNTGTNAVGYFSGGSNFRGQTFTTRDVDIIVLLLSTGFVYLFREVKKIKSKLYISVEL